MYPCYPFRGSKGRRLTSASPIQPVTPEAQPPDTQTLLLLAVEELDVHISELIYTGNFSISANFHDWVADSLTTKIEARLITAHETSRFKDSLRLGEARAVIGHWVRHWVCMEIKQHFGQYVQFCPCTTSFIARRMSLSATPASSMKQQLSASERFDI